MIVELQGWMQPTQTSYEAKCGVGRGSNRQGEIVDGSLSYVGTIRAGMYSILTLDLMLYRPMVTEPEGWDGPAAGAPHWPADRDDPLSPVPVPPVHVVFLPVARGETPDLPPDGEPIDTSYAGNPDLLYLPIVPADLIEMHPLSDSTRKTVARPGITLPLRNESFGTQVDIWASLVAAEPIQDDLTDLLFWLSVNLLRQ